MKRLLTAIGTAAAAAAIIVTAPISAQADPVGAPGMCAMHMPACTWAGPGQWDIALDADLEQAPGRTMTMKVWVDGQVADSITVTNEEPAGSWMGSIRGGGSIKVTGELNPGPEVPEAILLGAVRWGGR